MKASANSERGSFREFEHTADVGIDVAAADWPALFAIAGEGLFALIVDSQTVTIRDTSATIRSPRNQVRQ
jgi:SHS2 domain-containing protein